MNPAVIRDKYRDRERSQHIETILKLMREFNITSADLDEYMKTHEIDLRQQVVNLKKKSKLRGIANGIRGRKE